MARTKQTAKQEPQQIEDLAFNINGWAAKIPGGIFERHGYELIYIRAWPVLRRAHWSEVIEDAEDEDVPSLTELYRKTLSRTEAETVDVEQFEGLKPDNYVVVGFIPNNQQAKSKKLNHLQVRAKPVGIRRPSETDIIGFNEKTPPDELPLIVVATTTASGNVNFYVLLKPAPLCTPCMVRQTEVFYLPRFRDATTDLSKRAASWGKLIKLAMKGGNSDSQQTPAQAGNSNNQQNGEYARGTVVSVEENAVEEGGNTGLKVTKQENGGRDALRNDDDLDIQPHAEPGQSEESRETNMQIDSVGNQHQPETALPEATAQAIDTKLLHGDVLKQLPLGPKLRWSLALMTTSRWVDMKTNADAKWTGNTTHIDDAQKLMDLEDLDPTVRLLYELQFEEANETTASSNTKPLLHTEVMKLPLQPEIRWSLAKMVSTGYIDRSSNPGAPKRGNETGELMNLESLLALEDIDPTLRLLYQIWFEQHTLDTSNDQPERPNKRARIE